jgi:hypothetical protein
MKTIETTRFTAIATKLKRTLPNKGNGNPKV